MRDIEKAIDALARNPKSVKFSELSSLCAEFPSLSWLAASPDEALDGIRKLVGEVLEDMAAAGERPPAPFADRKYSGRFVVRVPPEVHRSLALAAAEEGVSSLNRLVNARRGAPAGRVGVASGNSALAAILTHP